MTKTGWVLAVAMVFGAGMARAQEAEQTADAGLAAWSAVGREIKGSNVFLVTMVEPKRRQRCHVLAGDERQIECSRHFGKKPKIYRRSEVLAMMRPATHDHPWLVALIPLSLGGGIIWGAVALSSITVVGAIPVAMVGGVMVLMAGLIGTFSDEAEQPEMVLYLKPGEALPFALRG